MATTDSFRHPTNAQAEGLYDARAEGLYDSRFEHDACGVGFVADLPGRRSHDIVAKGLTILRNLDHRGAKGSDPDTGDGAGILTQIPDALLRAGCGFSLPEPGAYAAGIAFLPSSLGASPADAVAAVERIAAEEGLRVLGWRGVPHEPAACGRGPPGGCGRVLGRLARSLRRRSDRVAGVSCGSLSSRTIVYKGMLTATQ